MVVEGLVVQWMFGLVSGEMVVNKWWLSWTSNIGVRDKKKTSV